MDLEILKSAAVEYISRGWNVIPLIGKIPPKGFALKKTFTERVTKMDIDSWPMFNNIGIVTGEISNLAVLDVDTDKGGKKSLEGKFIPLTRTVKTPRGGWHYYFLWNPHARTSVGGLGNGLDVRANCGYVVAPPSDRYSVVLEEKLAEVPKKEKVHFRF